MLVTLKIGAARGAVFDLELLVKLKIGAARGAEAGFDLELLVILKNLCFARSRGQSRNRNWKICVWLRIGRAVVRFAPYP